MPTRESTQPARNAELELCSKRTARKDTPRAFSDIPTDAVKLAKGDLELPDGSRGISYSVSFKGRTTGYIDLMQLPFNDLERLEPLVAKRLESLGFERTKVARIWMFYPLADAHELIDNGVGTAVLRKLLEELKSEGFGGIFAIRSFSGKLQRLLARNGFLSEDFVRDDGAQDTIWCKKFDNASLYQ
jgi:hypothetical protein